MAGQQDAFARFVTVLSTGLDEHRSTEQLASELYLSRSHFDRIIAATAGETPARFRRRVLLERAAFRLRTTDVGVLDIAVEAGYSSHEAFTRAFQRAYGSAPATWRTSSASVLLDAPNGVHFYPPGGLRLPAREQVRSMTFVTGLVDHHVTLLGQLLDRAATLTDEQLDAPIQLSVDGIDDEPTIRSLLARLVGQLDMWIAAMASQAYDFDSERGASITSLRTRLDHAGRAFTSYVREVSEHDRFDETYVDATSGNPYVFTAAGMIAHVLTYAAHRRTLVVGALSSAGAPELDDDPLSYFAPPPEPHPRGAQ